MHVYNNIRKSYWVACTTRPKQGHIPGSPYGISLCKMYKPDVFVKLVTCKNSNQAGKILVLGSDQMQVHGKKTSSRYSSWQHFCGLAGKVFQQILHSFQHSHGQKLCPSSSQHISVLIQRGIMQSLLLASKKQHLRSTSHIDTSMTYFPLITQTSRFIPIRCIPLSLRSKDTTESFTSALYLQLLLSIRRDSQVGTALYDKRDHFNFHISNFPFLSSNILSSPAFCVFISQLIHWVRAAPHECFILRAVQPEGLQNMLNALNNYCTEWNLTVNVLKTKIMVFRNGGNIRGNENWTYQGRKSK